MYQYRPLMDLYPEAIDELYEALTPEHAGMTAGELLTRIENCQVIARDAITYGVTRSTAAKRIGEHAAATLSMRKMVAA